MPWRCWLFQLKKVCRRVTSARKTSPPRESPQVRTDPLPLALVCRPPRAHTIARRHIPPKLGCCALAIGLRKMAVHPRVAFLALGDAVVLPEWLIEAVSMSAGEAPTRPGGHHGLVDVPAVSAPRRAGDLGDDSSAMCHSDGSGAEDACLSSYQHKW